MQLVKDVRHVANQIQLKSLLIRENMHVMAQSDSRNRMELHISSCNASTFNFISHSNDKKKQVLNRIYNLLCLNPCLCCFYSVGEWS